MLPFEPSTLCCELKNRHILKMPRVVSNQRAKFENDEIFRKLSRECEVRYTGFRDRPLDERQLRFQTECREGHADLLKMVCGRWYSHAATPHPSGAPKSEKRSRGKFHKAFVATGTNLQLHFSANAWSERAEDRVPTREFVNFDREPGKVHLKSQFILNGVCVIWRGWVDLVRLDGIGCLDFDEERAEAEDALLREQIEEYNRRLREFEDRQRQYRQEQERQAETEAEGPLSQGQGLGRDRGSPLSAFVAHDKLSYFRLLTRGTFGKTVHTLPHPSLIKADRHNSSRVADHHRALEKGVLTLNDPQPSSTPGTGEAGTSC